MSYLKKALVKHLSETAGDTADANPQAEMAKTVWEIGYPQLHELATAKEVEQGHTSLIVPYGEAKTPGTMTSGDYGVDFVAMTYVTISVNQIKGLRLGWTREYIEDCAWSALEPQLQEAGRAMEQDVFTYIVGLCDSGCGETIALTATLSYADILEGYATLAVDDYQMDLVLVNPADYANLLNDEKFINASYIDSAEPIRTGIINITLGAKIVSSSVVGSGSIYFLDKDKAIALATRRNDSVEEYSLPQSNEYGIVISNRYGAGVILSEAVIKGTITP